MSQSNAAATDGDLLRRLAALSSAQRRRALAALTEDQLRELNDRWAAYAHPGQAAPPGDWRVWLIRAGRGFGKTRAGAEWVSEVARAGDANTRIALVGASTEDVTKVMIEGPSGLIAVARDDEPVRWTATSATVRFANGASAHVYSAGAPEKLRGPEHHAAWCDEVAKWRWGDAAWDNLLLGLRLGERPRVLVTTTPKPVPLVRRIMALPGLIETRGRTRDNPHLPPAFVAEMEASYGGTRLGRQELDGELIEDAEGALWSRALIEGCRVAAAPALVRVVVGVDPPGGAGGDACGIVAVGLDDHGRGFVLEDASIAGASPEGWARAVALCAARHGAERVIAEKNQGGDMVSSVLRAADAGLAVKLVHASRGKAARAEPGAALYERGRVRHVGALPALEDELCGLLAGGGYVGPGRSPDRADACVWALTELMLGVRGRASVRALAD